MNDVSQLRKFLVDLTKPTISIHKYRQKSQDWIATYFEKSN